MVEYNSLARSYNVLDNLFSLKGLLEAYFKEKDFEGFSKRELHSYINEVLLRNYEGEEVIKYALTKYFKTQNVIAAFEVKLAGSRADFVAINGDSKSFEIKSNLDSLVRIEKQANDYSKIFEFNYALTGKKHLEKLENILPEHYGLWTINSKNKIEKYREAKMSPNLDSREQLKLFTKKELKQYFNSTEIEKIRKQTDPLEINSTMKKALKARYHKRWNFLVSNYHDILPINVQFFFTKNLKPRIVYDSN